MIAGRSRCCPQLTRPGRLTQCRRPVRPQIAVADTTGAPVNVWRADKAVSTTSDTADEHSDIADRLRPRLPDDQAPSQDWSTTIAAFTKCLQPATRPRLVTPPPPPPQPPPPPPPETDDDDPMCDLLQMGGNLLVSSRPKWYTRAADPRASTKPIAPNATSAPVALATPMTIAAALARTVQNMLWTETRPRRREIQALRSCSASERCLCGGEHCASQRRMPTRLPGAPSTAADGRVTRTLPQRTAPTTENQGSCAAPSAATTASPSVTSDASASASRVDDATRPRRSCASTSPRRSRKLPANAG